METRAEDDEFSVGVVFYHEAKCTIRCRRVPHLLPDPKWGTQRGFAR